MSDQSVIPTEPEPRQAFGYAGQRVPINFPVSYWPRPGDGRNGMLHFFATVDAFDEATGWATLTVYQGGNDIIRLENVPPKSEQNIRGWTFIDGLVPHSAEPSALIDPDALSAADVDALMHRTGGAPQPVDVSSAGQPLPVGIDQNTVDLIKELEKQVWGDASAVDQPLVVIVADLLARIKALEDAAPAPKKARARR